MQNNNPGRRSLHATVTRVALVMLLAFTNVQGQAGPPVAAVHADQESLAYALARYDQAIDGGLYNEYGAANLNRGKVTCQF